VRRDALSASSPLASRLTPPLATRYSLLATGSAGEFRHSRLQLAARGGRGRGHGHGCGRRGSRVAAARDACSAPGASSSPGAAAIAVVLAARHASLRAGAVASSAAARARLTSRRSPIAVLAAAAVVAASGAVARRGARRRGAARGRSPRAAACRDARRPPPLASRWRGIIAPNCSKLRWVSPPAARWIPAARDRASTALYGAVARRCR